jgi:hypothetical protein
LVARFSGRSKPAIVRADFSLSPKPFIVASFRCPLVTMPPKLANANFHWPRSMLALRLRTVKGCDSLDFMNDPLEQPRISLVRMLREIHFAMRLRGLWQRCDDDLDILDRMRGTFEGTAFDALRDALHMSLVQSLMRLHDTAKGTVSVPRLIRALEHPAVAVALRRTAWAPKVDPDMRLARARARYQAPEVLIWVKSLKTLRDELIAHTAAMPTLHGAKYGFESRLLDTAIAVYEDLDLVVTGTSNEFDVEESTYAAQANAFWLHVARPADAESDETD